MNDNNDYSEAELENESVKEDRLARIEAEIILLKEDNIELLNAICELSKRITQLELSTLHTMRIG